MSQSCQTDHRVRCLILLLRAERQRQGISANKLARKIGISRSAITNMDADIGGNPSILTLLKMADGLGVKISHLLAQAGG